MATIYQKLTDKTLILSPREAFTRQFNFGTDWTEIRMGFFFTGVTAAGDNTAASSETLVRSTNADRFAIGLKDSATLDLPGYGSSLFIGAITGSAGVNESNGSNSYFINGATNNAFCAAGFVGTTLIGGVNSTDSLSNNLTFSDPSGASGYNGFYGQKFVINDRGLSSQTVTISNVNTASVSGTDYSASALRTQLNNATYGTAKTIAWNDGAAARDIPDSLFLRIPFYNNRIRLSAIRAIRYAP